MSAAQTSTMLKGAGGQDSEQKAPVAETLTLRLVPRRKKKDERVHWSKDVQEINEFSGKFKSKKCCQFHKRRAFGEWSDEDDSDAECEQCSKPEQKPEEGPS
ncbi:hypothetical protein CHLRE_02g095110v5 [Chlamydomonas reinhardtii]|uniref:Flagellar-associated protein n=1 Tax=Chlamydomonas reinhardtii TaxID=3055 RepID=A8JEJ6_CHLRE|nr:uncharacterized protein CHLRE_02g095110v5 [Chlamydomonas reinhardtii]ACO07306.1 flagellar-associated protein [Chlamydomonas reinhardtii]PNW86725.1 hypothetical protein CHLRE_02g095110v5 [Chlamydomonas reinhardtii]|eukprot:XP_001701222.1 flagellar associated protein [Chlamydomonas reinhardtii]